MLLLLRSTPYTLHPLSCGGHKINEHTTAAYNACRSQERNKKNNSQNMPTARVSSRYQKVLAYIHRQDCGKDTPSSSSAVIDDAEKRKVGYAICEARDPKHRNVAILLFYPLSATSQIVDVAAECGAFDNYQATIISVDRPGVANTDGLPRGTSGIERIVRHADDVMTVIANHDIEHVYLLGVCLGHPHAVEVARRLLKETNNKKGEGKNNKHAHDSEQSAARRLRGLTLVAPFVSTSCPHSWRVARLGSSVPSFVLQAATSSISWIGSVSTPIFLTPKQLKKLISDEEQEEFGWKEDVCNDDFERAVNMALQMHKLSRNAQAIEARLGADASWQLICDEFAQELQESKCSIPIVIHACREDKIAPLDSIMWVARRCYGGQAAVTIDDRAHSHEIMTMFGGPPGRPVLMHEIAHSWGLLRSAQT